MELCRRAMELYRGGRQEQGRRRVTVQRSVEQQEAVWRMAGRSCSVAGQCQSPARAAREGELREGERIKGRRVNVFVFENKSNKCGEPTQTICTIYRLGTFFKLILKQKKKVIYHPMTFLFFCSNISSTWRLFVHALLIHIVR